LNFKGVDYKTEWVEYPDLTPTFKAFGIPPHDPDGTDESPDYTSPAVKFDDGTYAMDSKKIARELEKRYPSPSLHLDDPIVANFSLAKFQKHLIPHVVPKVPKLLNERSEEYFNRTRAVRFGMPLAQVEKEKATEERWEEAKEGLVEMADLLRQKGGPCFLGTTGESCFEIWTLTTGA
jgi:glutathione S-transferase